MRVTETLGPAELVDPFVQATDYFSTFGGGTAACAAALAVLRTIAEERIVERAGDVGARLAGAVRELADSRDAVAGVRGWGLAVGIDIVGPGTGRPDPGHARQIVEGMRDRGVLIGRTAHHGATLKLRPPLVFGDEHVALLTDALAACITTGG